MKRIARQLAKGIAVLGALFGAIGGTAYADILYGITFSNQLISINTTTGTGTLVGNLDTSMSAYGLASSDGNLYAFDQVAERIQQIDPATGHTLATFNIGVSNLVGEGDLAFRSDGTGFIETAGGPSGSGLLTFNLGAGTSSFLGASTIMDGLDFNSSNTLYGMSQGITDSGSKLYTVNQSTGALTLVGALNTPSANGEILGGLTFGSDGTLYGELSDDSSTSTLVKINPTTGQATVIGNIGFTNVSGISFVNSSTTPVPEPSSVLLSGTCILGAIGLVRRRVRSIRQRS
jgi:outer membrane protein assembly factor BamB